MKKKQLLGGEGWKAAAGMPDPGNPAPRTGQEWTGLTGSNLTDDLTLRSL